MKDRFRILTGGSRTALPRQQTLRATVDWSHDLLSEAERVLFRRLSVFAGGFDLDACETICGTDRPGGELALDLLAGLVNKSLAMVEVDAHCMRRIGDRRLVNRAMVALGQVLVGLGDVARPYPLEREGATGSR